MNRKILLIVLVLAVVLFVSTLVGTVAANRGQTKKQYVDYEMQAVLNNAVYTVDTSNFPLIIIDGYRPAEGVQSLALTINGEEYSYPEDFDYAENFHLENNVMTGLGKIQVKSVFTFNLPGKPTITEYVSGQSVATGARTDFDGVFYVTGTKMFNKVEGGGIMDSYGEAGTDNAIHTGLIKGWPFGE